MLMRTIRLSTSLLLSLLLCEQVPAQAPSPSQLQATIVRPDPKHAHRAAERGDKAQAAGPFHAAAARHEGGPRYPPPKVFLVATGGGPPPPAGLAPVPATEPECPAGPPPPAPLAKCHAPPI